MRDPLRKAASHLYRVGNTHRNPAVRKEANRRLLTALGLLGLTGALGGGAAALHASGRESEPEMPQIGGWNFTGPTLDEMDPGHLDSIKPFIEEPSALDRLLGRLPKEVGKQYHTPKIDRPRQIKDPLLDDPDFHDKMMYQPKPEEDVIGDLLRELKAEGKF